VHKDKIAVRFDATDEYDILAKVSFFYPIPVLLGRYSWAILVSSLLGRLEIDRLVRSTSSHYMVVSKLVAGSMVHPLCMHRFLLALCRFGCTGRGGCFAAMLL
jgi:hypothetical protein